MIKTVQLLIDSKLKNSVSFTDIYLFGYNNFIQIGDKLKDKEIKQIIISDNDDILLSDETGKIIIRLHGISYIAIYE